ncbi:MAG TPA: hypothetical protein VNK43_05675, partial [Gemmatimonadales bacterium]|nr:hypothetical protein [Gemmatimonadales bacterium]
SIVAEARQQSPFLGEALAAARVREAVPPELTLALGPDQAHLLLPIEGQHELTERLVSRRVGAPVRLRVVVAPAAPAAEAPQPPLRRLSQADVKAEQLRHARAADRALDLVADELDLEIVD